MSLEDLARQIEQGEVQEVNVIIKADVVGSAEAVKASMEKIEVEGESFGGQVIGQFRADVREAVA